MLPILETVLKAEYDRLLKCYLQRAILDYRTLKFRGLGARERGIETPGLERAFITIRMAAEAEEATGGQSRQERQWDEDMPEMRQAAETVELAAGGSCRQSWRSSAGQARARARCCSGRG